MKTYKTPARIRARVRARYYTAAGRATISAYKNSPAGKASIARSRLKAKQSLRLREYMRAYNASPAGRAAAKRYRGSPAGQAAHHFNGKIAGFNCLHCGPGWSTPAASGEDSK